MREILFRGKRKDTGVWVYGDLVHSQYKIGDTCVGQYGNTVGIHQVNPETVGQFIGLTDRTGKKIFEGDVLSEHGSLFAVVYDKKWAKFKLQYIGRCIQYPEWNRGVQMEIVGNIHDNPELLEG